MDTNKELQEQEMAEETNSAEETAETAVEETSAEEPVTAEETVAEENAVEEEVAQQPVEEPTAEESAEKTVGQKRTLTGRVVSSKPDKTISVLIERQVAHPLYKKYYKQSKKVMAHDESNDCNEGDLVKIIEHRPLSAKKRWKLEEIIERAK